MALLIKLIPIGNKGKSTAGKKIKDVEGSTDYSYVKSYIKNAIKSEQLQYALAGLISPVTVNSFIRSCH